MTYFSAWHRHRASRGRDRFCRETTRLALDSDVILRFGIGRQALPRGSMRLGAGYIVIAAGLALASGHALAQKAPAALAPSVIVATVVSQDVTDTSNYIGRVTAINKVDIVARVPGFIEERTFTEGQLVKRGDLLFRIEQDTYKAAVEQQQANLAKAKAVEVNASLQLQRGKALLPKQFVPQSQVDQQTAGGARSGQYQLRLHQHPFANRRSHRHRHLYRRQSGWPDDRKPRDHCQL
jgi:hypothetical protein